MDMPVVHDGGTVRDAFKARVGRMVARTLECAGVLWAVYCAGNAVWGMVIAERLSDAISDAIPVVLAGGLGFCVAWWMASVVRRVAACSSRPRRWRTGNARRTARRTLDNRRLSRAATACP